jgi:hypothetical protein
MKEVFTIPCQIHPIHPALPLLSDLASRQRHGCPPFSQSQPCSMHLGKEGHMSTQLLIGYEHVIKSIGLY